MENVLTECILCDNKIKNAYLHNRDTYRYKCERCGEVCITEELAMSIRQDYKNILHLVSGFTRERNEKNLEPIVLSTTSIEQVLSTQVPRSVPEKVDRLLQRIANKSEYPGAPFRFDNSHDYPLGYTKNIAEYIFYIEHLKQRGLVKEGHSALFNLTVAGWERIEELRKQPSQSKQCFVAMKFNDEELDKAYKEGIKPAIKSANYESFRIDEVEHIDKICDRIIVEIDRSIFLVADVTHQNQGVYFEAGYAMGKDIPVIWSCHKGDKDNRHFDTEHYNHILWEDTKDLKQKLEYRILATIGEG